MDLPDYVEKAFVEKKCAIARFRGQTHLYIPRIAAKRVGKEMISRMAAEVFTQSRLNEHGYHLYETEQYFLLDLPQVIGADGPQHPDYNLPDKLADKVLAAAK